LSFGGEWLKYELNFDNAFVSVRTLFILQSTEGWVDLLWTGIDAYKIDYNPIREYNPAAFFFFMASIILFSLFFLNLFVGVVIDTFKREKDILSRNNELNADQREWISIYTMILSSSPQLKFKNTGNPVVDKCRYIA
jgi:signal transduction histidine kinase